MKSIDVLSDQIEQVPEYIARMWPLALEQAQSLPVDFKQISQVLIGGCGDSHHAALGLELALGRNLGSKTRAMEAMHLARYAISLSGDLKASQLVIGISASGEVARTIEAIEVWREAGARTVAFTTNSHSTLAESAEYALVLPAPDIPHGPGLLSYIGNTLLGYAIIAEAATQKVHARLNDVIQQVPELLRSWVPQQIEQARIFADEIEHGMAVILGSGPAAGSARFGAAKLIEAVGEPGWAQDVEEWAHLEYFCDPADLPTILLGTLGRAYTREIEIQEAMKAIGRKFLISRWVGAEDWSPFETEVYSPLALWAAPSAFASRRAEINHAIPFRGFGGGRSIEEGGGASRIRSSDRLGLDEWVV